MSRQPLVSVLMPVYNGERFLRQAIDSILKQTFTDFELIIVNDGSTDASSAIITSYEDQRIVAVNNDGNRGIVETRNRCIDLARSAYIALMDCDDVSMPERLAAQVSYLQDNPSVAAVATCIVCCDEDGSRLGDWPDDRAAVTSEQIRAMLPKANCIAQSSLMVRADVMGRYRYRGGRDAVEDYDLLLRLAAAGLRLAKLPAALVRYRIVGSSLSSAGRLLPPEYRHLRAKEQFLGHALAAGELNAFTLKVCLALMRDAAYLWAKKMFRLLMGEWPADNRDRLALQLNGTPLVRGIVRLTAFLGALLPLRNRSGLFFFFPFFHTGGAERVHADIVGCFAPQEPWVIFTKRSSSRAFLPLFQGGARILNLWPLCKYLYPVSVGLAAGFINRHPRPAVFGANSLFYALLLPFLKPHVRCGDLIHAFGAGVEEFTLPAAARLDRRVVITRQTLLDLQGQYTAVGLDPGLTERIVLIENRVAVPEQLPPRPMDGPLEVLFVGRGSAEKRIHLLGRAARRCRDMGLAARFTLVGDAERWLDAEDASCCRLAGTVTDEAELLRYYDDAHLLLITSSREGFPLTVMEGMAHGCVPVCTAVGGIPEHVRHGENGWLLPAEDDEAVVTALCQALTELDRDRRMLARLSAAAHAHARQHFGGEGLCDSYRQVILGP